MSETQMEEVLARHTLPEHWKPPNVEGLLGCITSAVFQTLCTCAFGQPSLNYVWASVKQAEEGDESVWIDRRKRMIEQQNNILILAGLLLATSSVFITTSPPYPAVLNYTRRGPYFCICSGFALLAETIVVTSICVLVTSKLTPTHTSKVLLRNKLHVHLTLFVLSYPSVSTGAATVILAIGILAAVWGAVELGAKLVAAAILLLPFLVLSLFFVTSSRGEEDLGQTQEGVGSLV